MQSVRARFISLTDEESAPVAIDEAERLSSCWALEGTEGSEPAPSAPAAVSGASAAASTRSSTPRCRRISCRAACGSPSRVSGSGLSETVTKRISSPATRPSAFGSDGVRSAASHSPERKQSE